MTIKISQLASITPADMLSATITAVPVAANPTGTLTTYQITAGDLKTYIGTGNLNVTGNITSGLDSTFKSNLTILGNLIVQGNTINVGSNNVATTDNILELHVANTSNIAQPWTVDDGKDIGIRFHYYAGSDRNAALVLASDTKFLEFYNNGAEGNTVFTGTSYGTFKTGELALGNNTAASSTITGALRVAGGAGIGGSLYAGGSINGQSTLSITSLATVNSLQVNASTTIGTTLNVSGASTLASFAANLTGSVGSSLVVGGQATVNSLVSNGAVSGTTAKFTAGQFTTLNGSSTATVNSLVSNGAVSGTTAQFTAGQFTTLNGSSTATVNSLVSNGAVSGTTAQFTTLNSSGAAIVDSLSVNNSVVVGTTLAINGTTTTNAIVPSGNANVDIGTSAKLYNNVYGVTFVGTSTTAKYADLAEKYVADAVYEPGTVVIFGGAEEITTTQIFADTRIAGAISTDPAYLMNSAADGLAVALRGKIPVKVVGAVAKGDLLVSSTISGFAQRVGVDVAYSANAVFAKSMVDDSQTNERVIWAVIV